MGTTEFLAGFDSGFHADFHSGRIAGGPPALDAQAVSRVVFSPTASATAGWAYRFLATRLAGAGYRLASADCVPRPGGIRSRAGAIAPLYRPSRHRPTQPRRQPIHDVTREQPPR